MTVAKAAEAERGIGHTLFAAELVVAAAAAAVVDKLSGGDGGDDDGEVLHPLTVVS